MVWKQGELEGGLGSESSNAVAEYIILEKSLCVPGSVIRDEWWAYVTGRQNGPQFAWWNEE